MVVLGRGMAGKVQRRPRWYFLKYRVWREDVWKANQRQMSLKSCSTLDQERPSGEKQMAKVI